MAMNPPLDKSSNQQQDCDEAKTKTKPLFNQSSVDVRGVLGEGKAYFSTASGVIEHLHQYAEGRSDGFNATVDDKGVEGKPFVKISVPVKNGDTTVNVRCNLGIVEDMRYAFRPCDDQYPKHMTKLRVKQVPSMVDTMQTYNEAFFDAVEHLEESFDATLYRFNTGCLFLEFEHASEEQAKEMAADVHKVTGIFKDFAQKCGFPTENVTVEAEYEFVEQSGQAHSNEVSHTQADDVVPETVSDDDVEEESKLSCEDRIQFEGQEQTADECAPLEISPKTDALFSKRKRGSQTFGKDPFQIQDALVTKKRRKNQTLGKKPLQVQGQDQTAYEYAQMMNYLKTDPLVTKKKGKSQTLGKKPFQVQDPLVTKKKGKSQTLGKKPLQVQDALVTKKKGKSQTLGKKPLQVQASPKLLSCTVIHDYDDDDELDEASQNLPIRTDINFLEPSLVILTRRRRLPIDDDDDDELDEGSCLLTISLDLQSDPEKMSFEATRKLCGLRNSGGGGMEIHSKQKEIYTEFNDHLLPQCMKACLVDDEFSDDVYTIKEENGVTTIDAQRCLKLVTCDYNTKITLENNLINPTRRQVKQLMHKRRSPVGSEAKIRGQSQNLKNGKTVAFKQDREIVTDHSQFVKRLFVDLNLREYITAFSQNKDGGSYLLEIELHDKQTIQSAMHQYIREHLVVLEAHHVWSIPPDDLTRIILHKIKGTKHQYLLEVSVRPFHGIVFYDTRGPESYRINEQSQLVRLTKEEWLARIFDS